MKSRELKIVGEHEIEFNKFNSMYKNGVTRKRYLVKQDEMEKVKQLLASGDEHEINNFIETII